MRKIYFSIITILFLNSLFAQLASNHWKLGVSDVNFSTNPPSVINNSTNINKYGNASVSDSNGNLLFYTDGLTIWNKNNQIIPNNGYSLAYAPEAEQSVIIVPYPGQNKYFVFSQKSDNLLCCGTNFHIYTYGIVDFTNNELGEFQSLGNLNFQIESSSGYRSRYGGITFAKNSAGNGYWIILNGSDYSNGHDQKIYSYSLTSSGLNLIPTVSNFVSLISNTSNNPLEKTLLKISPNNNTLGVIQSTNLLQNSGNSAFCTFSFNSATGAFSNQTNIGNIVPSGSFIGNSFEFSSDSQKVYFVNTSLTIKDLSNSTVLPRTITLPALSGLNLWHIQRDRFENILIGGNGYNFIKKIDNQNSFSLASISTNDISLTTNLQTMVQYPYGYNYSLPQLIPELNICQADKMIDNLVTATQDFRVSNLITASSAISNNITVNFRANQIVLKPGFTVSGNVTGKFRAYVDPCVYNTASRMVSNNSKEELGFDDSNTNNKDQKNSILVYPNPNNGIFKFSLKDTQDGLIEITNLYGFTVFKKEFKNQLDFEINLQGQSKGIYILKVISENQIYTSQIIKN